jgi:serine phosphatase RsbU (regulator of sigma subunit)
VWTPAGAVSVESCGGPPLGAGLAPDRYDESVLVLQPGETVLLYTDGLVERRRRPFEDGVERLRTVLEADRGTPLTELVASLPELLSDQGALEDDCCILALRRRS